MIFQLCEPIVINKQEILALRSEINALSLERAEHQEREQLYDYTVSPLDMDIFMGGEQTQVLKTTRRSLPRPWFFPWVHFTGWFLELVLENYPVLAQQW